MTLCFQEIAIHHLKAGKYQARRDFNPEHLKELANSIKEQGIIEPLVVRPISAEHYEIIAGERRWRAAQLAGFEKVPCVSNHYSEHQAAAVGLIENIQRQALNLMEEAHGYRRLMDEFGFLQEDLAAWLGKSRSHIANVLRLLQLPLSIQNKVQEEKLSFGHARALVGLDTASALQLAHLVEKEQLSVRTLEKKVQLQKKNKQAVPKQRVSSKDIEHLESLLAEQLGTPVSIAAQGSGGWLKIRYFDNDTLSGLLQRLGLDTD